MSQLLTAQQVADMFQVNVHTVYVWAETGKLPAVRLSRSVLRFRPEDVAARIEDAMR